MAAGRWVFFATIVVAGLLATVGIALFQPQWRTATEAEVRATLDPSLVAVDLVDSVAQRRMDRLDALLKKISAIDFDKKPTFSDSQKFLARERMNLRELDSLLSEGPLQRRPLVLGAIDFPNYTAQKQALKSIALSAPLQAQAGREPQAVALISLGHRLTSRLHECETSLIAVLVDLAMDSILDVSIHRTIPYLGEAELKQLASALPPVPKAEPNVHRALRSEFQAYLLPMLPDPIAWSRKASPDEDPHQSLGQLLGSEEDDEDFILGNFDARDCVEIVNRTVPIALSNALLPRAKQDGSGQAYAAKLESTLPYRQSAGQTGYKLWMSNLQYRWEMTRTPNSFGKFLVLMSTGVSRGVMDVSFRRRAEREGTRTLIALRRYRLRTKRAAPSLTALVSTGLLPALPFDHCGSGPLHYDPKRSLLWSVGKNGVDDGGTSAAPSGTIDKPDIVWETH